jgi:hypothetical protein
MGSIRKIRIIPFCFVLLFISILIVSCKPKDPVNMGSDGIAIKGYDSVAYFTMRKPVKGDHKYTYEWKGAKWLFENKAHIAMFAADPEKYAPQFGGY